MCDISPLGNHTMGISFLPFPSKETEKWLPPGQQLFSYDLHQLQLHEQVLQVACRLMTGADGAAVSGQNHQNQVFKNCFGFQHPPLHCLCITVGATHPTFSTRKGAQNPTNNLPPLFSSFLSKASIQAWRLVSSSYSWVTGRKMSPIFTGKRANIHAQQQQQHKGPSVAYRVRT